MANIAKFGIPLKVGRTGVRLSRNAEFLQEPDEYVWNTHEPDKAAAKAWLDENAPGWTTQLKPVGLRERELPVGQDTHGTFVEYEVRILFLQAAHRDAWIARHEELLAADERKRAHVAECEANAPEGVEVCDECGAHMQAFVDEETMRLAQFAFVTKRNGFRCPQCRCTCVQAGPNWEEHCDALDMAQKYVGLPAPDEDGWNDDVLAERLRRKAAPPVATVHVEETDTARDIIRKLEEGISAAR